MGYPNVKRFAHIEARSAALECDCHLSLSDAWSSQWTFCQNVECDWTIIDGSGASWDEWERCQNVDVFDVDTIYSCGVTPTQHPHPHCPSSTFRFISHRPACNTVDKTTGCPNIRLFAARTTISAACAMSRDWHTVHKCAMMYNLSSNKLPRYAIQVLRHA